MCYILVENYMPKVTIIMLLSMFQSWYCYTVVEHVEIYLFIIIEDKACKLIFIEQGLKSK